MPLDTKRIQGPETSTPYDLFYESKEDEEPGRDISSQRNDGRKNDQLREIFLKTAVISQAKGSAYLEMNKTKVICSVFDPREIPRKSEFSVNGELYCEFKYAPFSGLRRRGHQQDADEKQMSVHLKRALEPAVCRHEFPNLQVDVYVLVLENDGSALAAAITCAGLALADASVPMFDLVVGVSMGITSDGIKFIDPTLDEEAACCIPPENGERSFGKVTAGFLPSLGQMSQIVQDGSLDIDKYSEMIKELSELSREAYKLSQECLVKAIQLANERKVKEVKN
ncbi:exosome complex component MTR3-like [Ischnura elegans]|uniref:exosome complex component MTR3-like n=1 Tax=Ischnura elegans TaxID=197161 RepID=UPI001ED86907|nr:exosome complex component MTR3-like [Ischnura elegans]